MADVGGEGGSASVGGSLPIDLSAVQSQLGEVDTRVKKIDAEKVRLQAEAAALESRLEQVQKRFQRFAKAMAAQLATQVAGDFLGDGIAGDVVSGGLQSAQAFQQGGPAAAALVAALKLHKIVKDELERVEKAQRDFMEMIRTQARALDALRQEMKAELERRLAQEREWFTEGRAKASELDYQTFLAMAGQRT